MYTFVVREPQGKELDVASIVWEGPPGLSPASGSASTTCRFDNWGLTYTVTARGKFKGSGSKEGKAPAATFTAVFTGAVYAPVVRFVTPTENRWVAEGNSGSTSVKAVLKAQYGGEQDITGADIGWTLRLVVLNGQADPSKATLSTGATASGSGSEVADILQVTFSARKGEKYTVSAEFSISYDGYVFVTDPVTSDKFIGVFGVEITTPSQSPWVTPVGKAKSVRAQVIPEDVSGGTFRWKQNPTIGAFADENATMTNFAGTMWGETQVSAEYERGGETAGSPEVRIVVLGLQMSIWNTEAQDDDCIPVGAQCPATARLLGPWGFATTVNFSTSDATVSTVSPSSGNMTVGTVFHLTITGISPNHAVNWGKLIGKIQDEELGREDFTVFEVGSRTVERGDENRMTIGVGEKVYCWTYPGVPMN